MVWTAARMVMTVPRFMVGSCNERGDDDAGTAASAGSVGVAGVDVEEGFGDKCAEDEAEEHDGVP